MKILVIDDDPQVQALFDRVLARAGFEVLLASNAEGALELIRETRLDVALCDLNLPGMDGLALAPLLKKNSKNDRLALLAMSGFPESWVKEAALGGGFRAFIAKPISPEHLINVLTTVHQETPR